jgi:protein TonB
MSAATQDLLSSEGGQTPCRRKHRRETLTWALVYVEFGQDNGGIALNLSEHGLSVQAAMPLVGETFPDMRLKGGCDRGWLPVIGRLAWIGENRKTAGIQFVELSTEARRRISSWIALEHPQHVADPPLPSNGAQIPNHDAIQSSPLESKLPPSQHARSNSGALPGNRLFGFDTAAASPRGQSQKEWYRRRPRRKNLGATAVVLLCAFLFGVGLMLGSGLLGRLTKTAKDLTSPPTQQVDAGTDASTAPDAKTSGLTTPDNSLPQPPSLPSSMIEPDHSRPFSHNSPEDLPSAASDNNSQRSAAPSAIPQRAAIAPAATALPSAASAPLVSTRNSVAAPVSNSAPPPAAAAPAQKAVDKPALPASPSAIQTPLPPTTSPNVSVHSENDFRPANAPSASAANTTAPPNSDAAPPATRANAAEPAQPSHFQPVALPGGIEPGRLLHSVEPIYPSEAKKQRLEGIVELRLVVATDGSVRSIKLVSGDPLLASAAMSAAREFRYSPASLNGQPIEAIQTIDMSFKLPN